MIRTLTKTEANEIAGAIHPVVAGAGVIVAAHYGDKALDAFDAWVANKWQGFVNSIPTPQAFAYSWYYEHYKPSYS